MRQAIIWTNADPTHRRIYAALGRDELICDMKFSVWHGKQMSEDVHLLRLKSFFVFFLLLH